MPNERINRDLSNSLRDAFGGSPAPSDLQQPTPAAPPTGGPASGPLPGEDPKAYFLRTGQRMDPSVYQAMVAQPSPAAGSVHQALRPQVPQQVDPYMNLANKATGKQYQ